MKPLEILVALPKWAKATPDQVLDSPAFAMPCRLGEEQVSLRLGAVQPSDTLDLAILFGDERHSLRLARSTRFSELDKVWDSRADMPDWIRRFRQYEEEGDIDSWRCYAIENRKTGDVVRMRRPEIRYERSSAAWRELRNGRRNKIGGGNLL